MAQPKRLRDALDRNLAGYPVVTVSPAITPKNPGDDQAVALAVVLVDESGAPVPGGSSASPSIVVEQGAASIATAQVSVASIATVIAAARATREAVTITNSGTTDVYVGGATVTTGTGALLPGVKGASLTIPTTAAVYGIVASGTQTVSVLETYQ